jgi:hypothetical protein
LQHCTGRGVDHRGDPTRLRVECILGGHPSFLLDLDPYAALRCAARSLT